MRIAFYFARTWDWNGADLESGLGGAETAIVYLARAFARAGHEVAVFNGTTRPAVVAGVSYRNAGELGTQAAWDVLVSVSRIPGVELVPARVKVHLSMEDSESWVGSYRDYLPRMDALFTLSPHHTRLVVSRFGVDPARVYTTRLGVWADDYAQMVPKRAGQMLYCSIPDCGLAFLPAIFSRVRAHVPEATLVVTGDLTLWGRADPGLRPYLPSLKGLPGVRVLGKVPRGELIRLQKESVLHLYPCCCNELFCLSSIECQAAACPTVAPRWAALESTVADGESGVLVARAPHDPGFADAMAAAAVRLLRDRAGWARLAAGARARALRCFTYDGIAAEWEAEFRRLAAAKGL